MNNVVTIDRKALFSDYAASQKTNRVAERTIFFGGILVSMILPKLIFAEFAGPESLSVFALLGSASIILGVARYLNPAPGPLSIMAPRTRYRAPDTLTPTNRKAA